MKKLALPLTAVFLLMLAFSACKKDDPETFGPMSQIAKADASKKGSASNLREDDCFYIPFTQTGANTWTVNQNGVNMTFTDLHLKADGRLYGKLASAGLGNNIVTGGDGYNGREYAVEIPNCMATYNISKTVELISDSLYTALYGGGSFLVVNGQGATGGNINMTFNMAAIAGVGLFSITPGQTKVTHYDFNNSTSCTGTRLILGKLYAKGVVRHPGPNGTETFTFTELGIASMCLEDEFIAPLPPPPPPPVGPPLPLS
ncbi:MAG: hypothetical protein ACRCYO_07475 [Bacteroidia bacterium]